MTFAQITAIIGLLLAFNTDAETVAKVKEALEQPVIMQVVEVAKTAEIATSTSIEKPKAEFIAPIEDECSNIRFKYRSEIQKEACAEWVNKNKPTSGLYSNARDYYLSLPH